MSGRVMASRINHFMRGRVETTAYSKRMDRLSNRIFNEVSILKSFISAIFRLFDQPTINR
jgi:hypothetical protein